MPLHGPTGQQKDEPSVSAFATLKEHTLLPHDPNLVSTTFVSQPMLRPWLPLRVSDLSLDKVEVLGKKQMPVISC